MDGEFAKRVRSAAIAGWWTLLITWICLVVNWAAYLLTMAYKPEWMMKYWLGKDMDWSTIQTIWLWCTAAFKMVWWVAVMVVIWLSLWARRLRKA
jgi:hypothetical protein